MVYFLTEFCVNNVCTLYMHETFYRSSTVIYIMSKRDEF